MSKPFETQFKRIESKYILSKDLLAELMQDFKDYLVEDDFPTSTITNIYFDTPDFQVIKDSMAKKNQREKIRMRSYHAEACLSAPAFLEIKRKDAEGVGHKSRIMADPKAIYQLLEKGLLDQNLTHDDLIAEVQTLRARYKELQPRVFIYYERFSLKSKHVVIGQPASKVRVTIDHNLVYRDYNVADLDNKTGYPLLDQDYVIMEIKAPAEKPDWLQAILDKHGIFEGKFSKYGTAFQNIQEQLSQVEEGNYAR